MRDHSIDGVDSVKWTRLRLETPCRVPSCQNQLVARDAEFGATGGATWRIDWLGSGCTVELSLEPCVLCLLMRIAGVDWIKLID